MTPLTDLGNMEVNGNQYKVLRADSGFVLVNMSATSVAKPNDYVAGLVTMALENKQSALSWILNDRS